MQPGEYHKLDRVMLCVGAGVWHAVALAFTLHAHLHAWAAAVVVVVGIGM